MTMETTVIGRFESRGAAAKAAKLLRRAGFARDELVLIRQGSQHRHDLLLEETADALRGTVVGAVVGGIGAGIAGALAAGPVFGTPWALALVVGGLGGAFGGGLLGYLIGSATGHQVQEHLEQRVAQGDVVLAVNTDTGHADRAHDVLRQAGSAEIARSVHRRHHAAAQSA
jgi:hypothetical protein